VKLRNVLILHKKSTFQIQAIEHQETHFLKLLEERHESVTRVKVAHAEHLETLVHVEAELTKRGIAFRSLARADMPDQLVTDVDLIITVGGDGTFLDASHHVIDVPLLGVNSSSSSSFGHFCLATERTLTKAFDDIESGAIELKQLVRLELSINDHVLPDLVLNEVLVAHSHPAATSRYFLKTQAKKEEQRSSGIWIGTPAGSTGSLRSAGAPVLPITAQKFEFVVREPCMRPGEDWKLLKGVLDYTDEILVVSQMRTGSLYIDGTHIEHHFGIADELVVKPSKTFLHAFIQENVNDIFLS
jgi:NAD+ kinase